MTREVASVTADTPLDQVVELICRVKIKRVPVTDGALVGIVHRADLLKVLGDKLREETSSNPQPDAVIRENIEIELKRRDFLPPVGVAVLNGEVHLTGAILDERERTAIQVIAENAAGVINVHDHLRATDPLTVAGFY
jgi:CBS-domain-containing membrane protein